MRGWSYGLEIKKNEEAVIPANAGVILTVFP